jgi:hypothetical protein
VSVRNREGEEGESGNGRYSEGEKARYEVREREEGEEGYRSIAF